MSLRFRRIPARGLRCYHNPKCACTRRRRKGPWSSSTPLRGDGHLGRGSARGRCLEGCYKMAWRAGDGPTAALRPASVLRLAGVAGTWPAAASGSRGWRRKRGAHNSRFSMRSGAHRIAEMARAQRRIVVGMRQGEHARRPGRCGGRASGLRPSAVVCSAARVRRVRESHRVRWTVARLV